MLNRGVCRYCRPDYRSVTDGEYHIYRRSDGAWCSTCSGCDKEQPYARKDHAKQSSINDWQCRKCVSNNKKFSNNRPIGDRKRLYNKFKKSAKNRGIMWDLTETQMFDNYKNRCALTGWPIDISYKVNTASLDRVDSNLGYVDGNVHWVHCMVNMCKNKYGVSQFIDMCCAIAQNHRTEAG